jgi:hypothetical protein
VAGSRDSAVGIATGDGLDDKRSRSSSPGRVKNCLSSMSSRPGSGVHATSYPMGTGALSPGVKRPGCESDHSPPTSTEVKKIWIYTPTPPYALMA